MDVVIKKRGIIILIAICAALLLVTEHASAITKVDWDTDDDFWQVNIWKTDTGYSIDYSGKEFKEYLRKDGWRLVLDSTDSNGLYLLNLNTGQELDHNLLYKRHSIKVKNKSRKKTKKVTVTVQASKIFIDNPIDLEEHGKFPRAKLKTSYVRLKRKTFKIRPNKSKTLKVIVPNFNTNVQWDDSMFNCKDFSESNDPYYTRVKVTIRAKGYKKTKKVISLDQFDKSINFSIK